MTDAQASVPSDLVYLSFTEEINRKTTQVLLGYCSELVKKNVKTIYLLLSSPGGEVMSGLTIYNVLRGLPVKLITHNIGNVDSIGNIVFQAGEERYSSPNSTFMFHGVGFNIPDQTRVDEKFLRERLNGLEEDQKRIGRILEGRTHLTGKDIKKLFLQGVTRDPDYALSKGIIDGIRDVKIPEGTSFVQLVFQR